MRNTSILMLLVLTATSLGFDAKKFSDCLAGNNQHNYAKNVESMKYKLQWPEEYLDEMVDRFKSDLGNYHTVGLLSKVKYSIKVKNEASLYDRNFFSDVQCKAIAERINNNVIPELKKYGVIEDKSDTADVPIIDIEILSQNDSQVPNVIWITSRLSIKRTLLDPTTQKPVIATVWEDRHTRVYTKKNLPLLYSEHHPDLEKGIIQDINTLVFLLEWSQCRSITTMEAAIQVNKEGNLSEIFSEYMIE